jgi:hypothetical protein
MSGELVIPLDDAGLDALEHALQAVTEVDEDGTRRTLGADYTLSQLLNFWSGYDQADSVLTGEIDGIPMYHHSKPCLSEIDLIRALVTEVRKLRAERHRRFG